MNQARVRSRLFLSYLTAFIFWGGVVFRAIPRFYSTPQFGVLASLLLGYALLFSIEWWVFQRFRPFRIIYFTAQMLIILALLFLKPPFDFFCVLLVPLSVQAFWYYSQKTATILNGLWMILVAGPLVTNFDLLEGLGYVVTYCAVLIFIGIVCIMTLRAEQADAVSQTLLAELREAHRTLQAYADQVEVLAAAEERNRLARELHDSVTQTIFSMTLTAQAARILYEREPGRLPAQLDRLQSLAQSALAEMRALIQQLHPVSVVESGLAAALRRHAAERQVTDGLKVDLQVSGERRLPVPLEEALFRIVQEALNNVVKHARTSQAVVTLCLGDNLVTLTIEDHGVGFDQARTAPAAPGHLGLAGMAERMAALGGKLFIESRPGEGTRIRVEATLEEVPEHV